MRLDIITIFPEYFAPLGISLIGKAVQRGDISVGVHDLRSWAHDTHRTVDDTPFGGGPGMVMRPEPWGEALDAVVAAATGAQPGTSAAEAGGTGPQPAGRQLEGRQPAGPQLIVPSPAGAPFDQAIAAQLAEAEHLIFACGRYEGIDARVVEYARSLIPVRELSIGDYVLPGGEPAVLVMIEAICRLLPGVLGNAESASDDSFGAGVGAMHGLVEGPTYTRPRVWRGREVPDVLLSGNHAAIARWRRDEALLRTARTRPDLAARLPRGTLSARDRQVLSDAGFAVMGEDVAH
ncbi:MAG TPA: tRNA (guanosine(37)-N1)-methyltransferase TrmD [Streptosporangiaceae bacterium]|nr:tRNA (guanosine(37)-N1)-methyltransferase TrmD [Streptosporangiaceae bacterium]